LPTGQRGTIVFSGGVVDKGGNSVCAPKWGPDGAPDELDVWPPTVPCDAGDTSDVGFTVEALRTTGGLPVPPPGLATTTFMRNTDLKLTFNAEMDPTSAANATITPAPPGPGTITASLMPNDPRSILFHVDGGLAAQTDYTLTVPSPTDYFGFSMPAVVVTFRTGN
jgi:hypothetical protein